MGKLITRATTENIQKIIDVVLQRIDKNIFIVKCENDFLYASEVYMHRWEDNDNDGDLTFKEVVDGTIKDVLPEYKTEYQSQVEEYIYDEAIQYKIDNGGLDTNELFVDPSKMDEVVNAVCNKFGYKDLVDAIASNPCVDNDIMKHIILKRKYKG